MSDGRVLVTGGTGFIGSRIVGALAARGKPVRCLVRGGESPRDGVEAAKGDMTDADSLRRAAEGCDVVVHLVAGKLGLPAEFQNRMAQATKNLIGAAKDAGVQRFVLMSSLGTDERTAGLTAYSRAKWEAQQALQASGLEWTVFKPSFVFGPDGGMLPDFKKLGRMPVIVVPGNGKRRLQPIWVDDVAAYYATSVDLPAAANRVFELGGPDAVTWNEFWRRMQSALGVKRPVMHVPMPMMRMQTRLTDRLPVKVPIDSAMLKLLEAGDNAVSDPAAREVFDLPLVPLDEQLRRTA